MHSSIRASSLARRARAAACANVGARRRDRPRDHACTHVTHGGGGAAGCAARAPRKGMAVIHLVALLCSAAALLGVVARPSGDTKNNDRPSIIHVLMDDLGWSEVGFHRNPASQHDVSTPVLDGLIAESLELRRFYTHKICSPARCALQTGRAPIHVNTVNVLPEVFNKKDLVGGYQGIPINMTAVAQFLTRAGYRTAAVGKWDVGMASPRHSPLARGYQSWLGYWHHSNDYWAQTEQTCDGNPVRDLWRINATYDGPAWELANAPNCTDKTQHPGADGERCVFEDTLLTQEVLRVLHTHAEQSSVKQGQSPLFLFWAPHLVHMPLQVPTRVLDKFDFIADPYRKRMHAMVHLLDAEIGTVISDVKRHNLWENTLMVIHADSTCTNNKQCFCILTHADHNNHHLV